MKLGERMQQELRKKEEQERREFEKNREQARRRFELVPLVVQQDLGPQLYEHAIAQIKEMRDNGGTFIKVDSEEFSTHSRDYCWSPPYIGSDEHLLSEAMSDSQKRTQIELARYLVERLSDEGFKAYARCSEWESGYRDYYLHDYGVQVSWR